MKNGKSVNFLNYKTRLRIRAILVCLLALVMLCSSTVLVVAETIPGSVDLSWNTSSRIETREQIKSRLLMQIKYKGWDPYSSDMTLDEYYALMELFNEGKLPLTSGIQKIMRAFGLDQPSSTAEGTGLFMPREKFFLVGLPSELTKDEKITNPPLLYNYDQNYEPYDPSTGELYTVIQSEGQDDRYVLDNATYVLSDTDGRLYHSDIVDEVTTYKYAFRLDGNKEIYVRTDDNKLQTLDGELYEFNSGSNLFTSLATGTVYILDNKDGLWKYDENASDQYVSPFNEASGDYYYIESKEQLYQFKNKALYIAGTTILVDDYIKALAYKYPSGYGYANSGYLRPSKDWKGIEVRDKWQALIVSEGINKNDYQISSDVDQSFFTGVQFDGYYVKQITIDGANVNVLGIIKVPETGSYVYYYLSAEGQNTQVSTTTLSDDDKFLIEYSPSEYRVEYEVKIDDSDGKDSIADILQNNANVADTMPGNVVFYGSNSATTLSWVDSIFGTTAQRPAQTTDGAYAFNVTVPYGYEMQIIISVDRAVPGTYIVNGAKVPDKATEPNNPDAIPYTFHADINHTDSRAKAEETWLNAYRQYLVDNKIIASANDFKYTRSPGSGYDSRVEFTWANTSDVNAEVHNAVFELIAERVNDMSIHNSSRVDEQSGYPLGRYPVYTEDGGGGKAMSSKDGPAVRTMNDTFYNHLVKANRKITAVLKYIGEPTFEIAHKVLEMANTNGRGTAATEEYAKDFAKLLEDFKFHRDGQYNNRNAEGDPFKHNNALFNLVEQDGGGSESWNWNQSSFYNSNANVDVSKDMWPARDGTYSYAFMFQTNSENQQFFMNTLEINGIGIQLPLYPLYNTHEFSNDALSRQLADEENGFPWYTETTLQDGGIVTVQYLALFNNIQRVYRIAIEGARSNVVINAMNLMQYGSGDSEFSVYNLVGVYDGIQNQNSESVQYYNGSEWETVQGSAMRVNGGKYPASDVYGATFRFKIAEGYANPYYYWTSMDGGVIAENNDTSSNKYLASVPVTTVESGMHSPQTDAANPVISLNEAKAPNYNGEGALVDGKLSPQYVYHNEDDDYYYIRITNHGKDKISFLTIVCRTIIYTVRYLPFAGSGDEAWNGFVIEESTGKIIGGLTKEQIAALGSDKDFELVANSMPLFTTHVDSKCLMWEMAQVDGKVPYEVELILEQFDDNGGNFYDLIYNNMAGIASNANGTIRPRDATGSFAFVSWVMVDENFQPIYIDEDFNTMNFSSGAIDFKVYKDYAVHNRAFNSEYADVYVIRLMPVWRVISNPYYYNVVLNWVDARGELHAENYDDGWDDVMTETLDNEKLFVFLNKDATPLKNWIALHPTYTFWDEVNNAITEFDPTTGEKDVKANTAKMLEALEDYLQRPYNEALDKDILDALVKRDYTGSKEVDDFDRLGGDVFRVNENGGTISIWMYENKGGLIFRKEVMAEPFIADDEFYFVIQNEGLLVNNGDGTQRMETNTLLTGEYKAYPQTFQNEEGNWGFYDKNGEFRAATDNDAWLVNFVDGALVSVKKINSDEPALPYFTLIHEEGIALYVPEGKYTVVEVGSKSGGSYQAEVRYLDGSGNDITQEGDGDDKRVVLPEKDEKGELWLSGNSTKYYPLDSNDRPQGVAQVPVTVTFDLGEHEVIQTLTFYNKTTSLAVKLKLDDTVYKQQGSTSADRLIWNEKYMIDYEFTVTLRLSEGHTPIAEEAVTRATGSYYFNMNIYSENADGELVGRATRLYFDKIDSEDPRYPDGVDEDANIWIGTFYLRPDETAAIVMQALLGEVNYWVDEPTDPNQSDNRLKNDLVPTFDSNRSGKAEPGGKKETTVTNWYGKPPEVYNGYLKITVSGDAQSNESFLFKITDEQGVSLIVSVKGGRSTYVYVPLGKYTIEEISGWSWRYTGNWSTTSATVDYGNSELNAAFEVMFNASPTNAGWLGGENSSNFKN